MKKTVTALAACAIALTAGAQTPKAVNQNPFLAPYTTPYEIPPFEQIKVSDYIPALKAGIEQHNKEIAAIANSKAEPTFENVILAMDRAGDILEKVVYVYGALSESNSSPELQAVADTFEPMLAAHQDEVSMNPALF